jgi:WD40 repeat protein
MLGLVLLLFSAGPPTLTGVDRQGDPLPPGVVLRLGSTRWRGAGDLLRQVAFSADGKQILMATGAGLRRFDADTGKLLPAQPGDAAVLAFALLPGGKSLFVGFDDRGGSLRAWRPGEGGRPVALPQPVKPERLLRSWLPFVSSEGGLVALSPESEKAHWPLLDPRTGLAIAALDTAVSGQPVFSADGKLLAATTSAGKALFDTKTGRRLRVLPQKNPEVDSHGTTAFAPDAASIIIGDRGLSLRDVKTGRVLARSEGEYRQVVFSPDGKSVAAFTDDAAYLLDARALRPIRTLSWRGSSYHPDAAFSPDGKRLVAATPYFIAVWDTRTGKRLSSEGGHEETVTTMAFSPDGSLLATGGSDGSACLWDVAAGRLLHRTRHPRVQVQVLCFSPDGRTLAIGSTPGSMYGFSKVRLFDVRTGRMRREFEAHLGWVRSLCFAPNGKVLASTGADRRIRWWDAATGKRLGQIRDLPEPRILGFLDADRVVIREEDGRCVAMSLKRGTEGWSVKPRDRRGWAVLQGGRLAILDGQRLLFHDTAGKRLSSLPLEEYPRSDEEAGAFSPDGKVLIASKFYELATGEEHPLNETRTPVLWTPVAFSPDGRWLASAAPDSSVVLWDAKGLLASRFLGPWLETAAERRQAAQGAGLDGLAARLRRAALAELTRSDKVEALGAPAALAIKRALAAAKPGEQAALQRAWEKIGAEERQRWADEAGLKALLARLARLGTAEARAALRGMAVLDSPTRLGALARAALDGDGKP